jgi:hypothetical protein
MLVERKIEKQYFYLSEFHEEEAWLSFMHREGWKLVSIKRNKYEFEKCVKENWVYQLAFKEDGIATDDYIQMFSDYGWEFVFQFRKWFYFRKKEVEVQKEDLTIFSDNESKIAMCKRVVKGYFYKVIPISIIFFCLIGLLESAKYSYSKIDKN